MTKKHAILTAIAIIVAIIIIFFVSKTAAQTQSHIVAAQYGNPEATTVVTMFGFVGCENCKHLRTSLMAIADTSPDVAFIWKDYPNTSVAPHSLSAALAARCAQSQDAFFPFQNALFDAPETLGQDYYHSVAEALELNTKKFATCLEEQKSAAAVAADIAEGDTLNITAVPTIFIGKDRYTGAFTERELMNLLNTLP